MKIFGLTFFEKRKAESDVTFTSPELKIRMNHSARRVLFELPPEEKAVWNEEPQNG